MNNSRKDFKQLLNNHGCPTKNYTLLIVSYESIDDQAGNQAVQDLRNKKLQAKQGRQGTKLYTIEHVQPLSGEEVNSIMKP